MPGALRQSRRTCTGLPEATSSGLAWSGTADPDPCRGRFADSREVAAGHARLVAERVWRPVLPLEPPEEIAQAVLFLASDAASFVNGVELFVEGGQVQI